MRDTRADVRDPGPRLHWEELSMYRLIADIKERLSQFRGVHTTGTLEAAALDAINDVEKMVGEATPTINKAHIDRSAVDSLCVSYGAHVVTGEVSGAYNTAYIDRHPNGYEQACNLARALYGLGYNVSMSSHHADRHILVEWR